MLQGTCFFVWLGGNYVHSTFSNLSVSLKLEVRVPSPRWEGSHRKLVIQHEGSHLILWQPLLSALSNPKSPRELISDYRLHLALPHLCLLPHSGAFISPRWRSVTNHQSISHLLSPIWGQGPSSWSSPLPVVTRRHQLRGRHGHRRWPAAPGRRGWEWW